MKVEWDTVGQQWDTPVGQLKAFIDKAFGLIDSICPTVPPKNQTAQKNKLARFWAKKDLKFVTWQN